MHMIYILCVNVVIPACGVMSGWSSQDSTSDSVAAAGQDFGVNLLGHRRSSTQPLSEGAMCD